MPASFRCRRCSLLASLCRSSSRVLTPECLLCSRFLAGACGITTRVILSAHLRLHCNLPSWIPQPSPSHLLSLAGGGLGVAVPLQLCFYMLRGPVLCLCRVLSHTHVSSGRKLLVPFSSPQRPTLLFARVRH